MNIEIGFTQELTNTRFAPLAILSAHYQEQNLLKPLEQVQIPMRERYFSSKSKLIQVLMSILAGCETLSEVNSTLRQEIPLAVVWDWEHFADQSSLSRTLDELTLKNIDELRTASLAIWKPISQVFARDWRKFLWLDFDLTPLPCGPLAEESQKGYFGEKKRSREAVSSGECHPKSRDPLVRPVPWQCSHPALLSPSRRRGRNCFRVIAPEAQTHGLADGWRGGSQRRVHLAAFKRLPSECERLIPSPSGCFSSTGQTLG